MSAIRFPVASLFSVTVCITACNNPSPPVKNVVAEKRVVPTDTMIASEEAIQTDSITSWSSFQVFEGQYPSESKLLDTPPLKARFNALVGKARKTFLERLKVTPPIEIQNHVLFDQGYMPGKSRYDEAAIAVDFDKDVIYIGFTINKNLIVFSEKGDTDYPEQFLQWMQQFQ
ncbi:hypothetical protein DVR12_18945 [Chitinophaga silvatica]|uniref:Uncharacterized protein n=1 Tax=Chitinophaga silvatica TaxID=2282649 RepID=A0A3E1Y6W2_9BACT|nr:hypothetical protein [Chitinophaga silvatica]RFS20641.1 hypothetical protein DVR12_18945 [Chitinophaga silvatica]